MPRPLKNKQPREHRDPGYERKKHWYANHREQVLAKLRQTCLGGRFRNLQKRPYTEVCEVCGCYVRLTHKQVEYHHWDDAKPNIGLWCCSKCHKAMTRVERGIDDPVKSRYLALKAALS